MTSGPVPPAAPEPGRGDAFGPSPAPLDPEAHEELRIALGALALDALDAGEAREVRAHLAGCPECQAEYASFTGVRRILDAGLAVAPESAPRPAPRRLSRRPAAAVAGAGAAGRAPRRTRVLQLGAVAGALALTVSAFLVGVSTGNGSAAPRPPAVTALPTATSGAIQAALTFRDAEWGTWVGVTMTDVPAGYTCKLVAYTADNREYPVSSWTAVTGQRSVSVSGAVALHPAQIDHFAIEVSPQGYVITIPMAS